MDYQHRAGGKTGSGGVASFSDANLARKERLKQIAMDVIDIDKDPYFMKNHLGTYECKLCLTLHNNPESYLTHTQGKKHQSNLQKRAAEQAKETTMQPALDKPRIEYKKFVKIGRPGYRVTKERDPKTGQQGMLFQIDYPEIATNVIPLHRFMSAYEQRVEAPDKRWQYLLFAAEPYETIAFKIPSREMDKDPKKFWHFWNSNSKQFYMQIAFKWESANNTNKGESNTSRNDLEHQRTKAEDMRQQLKTLSVESAKYGITSGSNSLPPPPPPPISSANMPVPPHLLPQNHMPPHPVSNSSASVTHMMAPPPVSSGTVSMAHMPPPPPVTNASMAPPMPTMMAPPPPSMNNTTLPPPPPHLMPQGFYPPPPRPSGPSPQY